MIKGLSEPGDSNKANLIIEDTSVNIIPQNNKNEESKTEEKIGLGTLKRIITAQANVEPTGITYSTPGNTLLSKEIVSLKARDIEFNDQDPTPS
mmetsp:Transcript_21735/g.19256  ORF Transcript_21735/g.19256 Transcript_21735/m.19256 type:complete len:94 (+) Transcript_21735:347-628(+)